MLVIPMLAIRRSEVGIDEGTSGLEQAAALAERSVSRRGLLKLAGLGAGVAVLSPIIAACGGAKGTAGASGAASAAAGGASAGASAAASAGASAAASAGT